MANRLPKFASEQAAPEHWSEKEHTAQEDWDSNIGSYNRYTNPSDKYLSNYDGSYVGEPIGAPVEQPVIGTDYIPTNQGVQPFVPGKAAQDLAQVVAKNFATQADVDRKYPYSGVFDKEFSQHQGRHEAALENAERDLYKNIVDVGDKAWYMTGQLGGPTSLPKLNLKEAVKASKGGRGSRGNRLADIETSKGGRGSRGNRLADIETSKGGRGSSGKHWADDIIDWKGHPSAGVTYPDVVSGPESIGTRIKEPLAFENFGSPEVFPTEDMGKWRKPGIPEGDIRAMMALEKGYAQPQPQNINTTLTPSQLDAIQNPGLQAPSVFDEPLDNGGTFAESPFVGPHDYATGNIQDASSSVDPRVLAGLNQQAVDYTMDLGRNNFADYVARLPQPEVGEAPKGVVDPRHMNAYEELMKNYATFGAGREVNPFERQRMDMAPYGSNAQTVHLGPQGVAPVDETIDQFRQNVPLNHDDRIQRIARAPRPQTERDTQMEMVKFYQSIGDNKRADDILRALDGGNSVTPDQSIGLKATLDHIFSRK